MSGEQLPAEIASRLLKEAEFHRLPEVPPEVEWFANPSNPSTRRAYENAIGHFMRFAGIRRPAEFRIVTQAHLISWREELVRRGLGGSTIRHRLSSVASLFEYLCEKNGCCPGSVRVVTSAEAVRSSGWDRRPRSGAYSSPASWRSRGASGSRRSSLRRPRSGSRRRSSATVSSSARRAPPGCC
ncbi:MAG: site-specific integrase [Acetobacteraceae bacterium]